MIIRDTYIVRNGSGNLVRMHRVEFRERLSCPKTTSRFFLEDFVELHGDRFYTGLLEITMDLANELIGKTRNL